MPAFWNTLVLISPKARSLIGFSASSATHPAVRPPVTVAMRSVSLVTWRLENSPRRTLCASRTSSSSFETWSGTR